MIASLKAFGHRRERQTGNATNKLKKSAPTQCAPQAKPASVRSAASASSASPSQKSAATASVIVPAPPVVPSPPKPVPRMLVVDMQLVGPLLPPPKPSRNQQRDSIHTHARYLLGEQTPQTALCPSLQILQLPDFDADLELPRLFVRGLLHYRADRTELCVADMEQILTMEPGNRTALLCRMLSWYRFIRRIDVTPAELKIKTGFAHAEAAAKTFSPAADDHFGRLMHLIRLDSYRDRDEIALTLLQIHKEDPENNIAMVGLGLLVVNDYRGFQDHKDIEYVATLAYRVLCKDPEDTVAFAVLHECKSVTTMIGAQRALYDSLFSRLGAHLESHLYRTLSNFHGYCMTKHDRYTRDALAVLASETTST